MAKISAIVPTYNRAEALHRCLDSLTQQTLDHDDYEIIIVDNDPTNTANAVANEVAQQTPCSIRYVVVKSVGLHYARNAGANAAEAAILAYTDDDAICGERWLEELLKVYEHDDVGCAGGKIVVKWDKSPPDWLLPYEAFYGSRDLGDKCRKLLPREDVFGANFSIRKKVLFEAGGFHPDSIGSERVGDGEVGLQRELHKSGVQIAWVPNAIVWHIQTVEQNGTLQYLKKRLRDHGAEKMYRGFIETPPSPYAAVASSIKNLTYACVSKVLAAALKIGGGRNWIARELCGMFYQGKATYTLQLLYRKDLRDWLFRDEWLNVQFTESELNRSQSHK